MSKQKKYPKPSRGLTIGKRGMLFSLGIAALVVGGAAYRLTREPEWMLEGKVNLPVIEQYAKFVGEPQETVAEHEISSFLEHQPQLRGISIDNLLTRTWVIPYSKIADVSKRPEDYLKEISTFFNLVNDPRLQQPSIKVMVPVEPRSIALEATGDERIIYVVKLMGNEYWVTFTQGDGRKGRGESLRVHRGGTFLRYRRKFDDEGFLVDLSAKPANIIVAEYPADPKLALTSSFEAGHIAVGPHTKSCIETTVKRAQERYRNKDSYKKDSLDARRKKNMTNLNHIENLYLCLEEAFVHGMGLFIAEQNPERYPSITSPLLESMLADYDKSARYVLVRPVLNLMREQGLRPVTDTYCSGQLPFTLHERKIFRLSGNWDLTKKE